MTAEERVRVHELLAELGKDTTLDPSDMERIDAVRSYVDSVDASDGALKEWEDKYKKLEGDYQSLMSENARITDAYRRRWDEATSGTMVNGKYVDKTVTRVDELTYENLMKGE